MAVGLPPRQAIPPEEKAAIAARNSELRILIDRLQALPDKPTTAEINTIAQVTTTPSATSNPKRLATGAGSGNG